MSSTPIEDAARAVAEALAPIRAGLLAGLSNFTHAWRAIREAEERTQREYLSSDRYRLDIIARKHRHDPVARSAAVGEYFTQRAHRELDELAERYRPPRPIGDVVVGELIARRMDPNYEGETE